MHYFLFGNAALRGHRVTDCCATVSFLHGAEPSVTDNIGELRPSMGGADLNGSL
jgi:hypothetical protein